MFLLIKTSPFEDYREYFKDLSTYYQKSCWDLQWESKITSIWKTNCEDSEIKKTTDRDLENFSNIDLQEDPFTTNISQDELCRTLLFYMQYFKKHTKPPNNYVCYICLGNDHYVKYCPLSENKDLTPYQGQKKCYGYFECSKCYRQWISSKSWANTRQTCKKCLNTVYPRKQWALHWHTEDSKMLK